MDAMDAMDAPKGAVTVLTTSFPDLTTYL